MGRSNFSVTLANIVMQTVSELQRNKQKAALKDIKEHIVDKYGNKSEKFLRLVPQYLRKGMNLGLIGKFGDHFRTKMYVAKRRRGKVGKRRKRRRRRH